MNLTRRTALQGVLGVGAASLVSWSVPAHAAGPGSFDLPAPGSCPVDPHVQKHDFRAMWLSSVVNIDWPSKAGLSADAQKAELAGWFDLAQRHNHNAILIQIRPTADAFWPGAKEPWSAYLTGTQGKDPGYDPLAYAIAEGRRRNIQVHGWFNPYRVAMSETPVLAANHPARLHPDWVLPYGGKLYYNPGLPEVRAHVVDAIMDAVRRYDLDGVHFDDYFYPYPVAGKVFDDAAAYARFGGGKSLPDWRRHNVTTFMTEMRAAIKAIKPWVQFGVSPFAIWRNRATDPSGSDTRAGVQTFDDLYADTRLWVKQGIVDYVTPQVYWSRGFAAADYEKVVSWWTEQVRGTNCNLYVGEAAYKVNANADPNWAKPGELSSHLAYDAAFPEVQGHIHFSAKSVRDNVLGALTLVRDEWYSKPALIPRYPWLDSTAPAPVTRLRRDNRVLTWTGVADDVASIAVYRVPTNKIDPCDVADARHLVATLPPTTTWTDPVGKGRGPVTYVVTTVDRLGNESRAVTVR
ncbi:glycoside hydrolase family 10 protein [Mariniluteicoccus flavus]